jgi:RNA polymerase sigma factor (sigma-70 family)
MNTPPHQDPHFLPHYDDVLRFMANFCRQRISEDHVQSAYANLLRRSYGENENHRSLFFTSAINDCRAKCRRVNGRKSQVVSESRLGDDFCLQSLVDPVQCDALAVLIQLEDAELYRKAMGSLEQEHPRQYFCLTHSFFHDLSGQQIGEILEVSATTVYKEIQKAFAFLCNQLETE